MLQAAGGRHADDEHPACEHIRGGKPQPAAFFERPEHAHEHEHHEHELHAVVHEPEHKRMEHRLERVLRGTP